MTRPTLIATLTLAALFALPAAAQHAGHAMPAAAASSPSRPRIKPPTTRCTRA